MFTLSEKDILPTPEFPYLHLYGKGDWVFLPKEKMWASIEWSFKNRLDAVSNIGKIGLRIYSYEGKFSHEATWYVDKWGFGVDHSIIILPVNFVPSTKQYFREYI